MSLLSLLPPAVLTQLCKCIEMCHSLLLYRAQLFASFTCLQRCVERAKTNIKYIRAHVLLSHMGYAYDMEMAASLPDIDLIIGGHSHSFLYTGEPPMLVR